MSEADERMALLQEGVDAFNRGDSGPALAIFSPDIECEVGPNLMNTGTYVGHDGYLQMIEAWGEAWNSIEARAISTEELENDHFLAEIHQKAVGAGSGVPVEMDIFWLFQFGGDKVVRFHLYASREEAVAAARE